MIEIRSPVTPVLDWNDIDTVLLDMDGTLLDLNYDNTVWNDLLPRYFAQHHELALEDASDRLFAHMRRVHGTIQFYCLDAWREFIEFDVMSVHDHATELICWRPGAQEFLAAVRALECPAVLATNAHRESVDIKDRHSGIVDAMDRVVSAHDYGHPKEQQGFWTQLQADVGFDPARTLFVDDNAQVLKAAESFGIGHLYTIVQPDSARPARDNLEFPALSHFDEIAPEGRD